LSSAGGGQGNALTGPAFVATIDSALKGIEAKFGVEIRGAIQDDMTIIGDADKVFGPNGALESLLALLEKAGLKPNRSKFQCLGSADGALKDAPEWLKPKAIDM
jgi:hypothetical protein